MTGNEPTASEFAATRSVVRDRYALLTPGGFVAARLPGWENADCFVLASPLLGAQFVQHLIAFRKDGQGRGNTGKTEYFAYLLDGSASVTIDARRHRLEAGDFVYIPPDKDTHFQGGGSRLLIFQRKYKPLAGVEPPKPLVGHQREVRAVPVPGAEGVKVQVLLPETAAFDLAVNIFTHQPAIGSPVVQTPSAEQGHYLLQGEGLFRLGEDCHPVQAGDSVWIAAYRPRGFLAKGSVPASYIRYSETNRDPM